MRHLKVKRVNVAHRLPREKRASGTEINYFQQQQSFTEPAFYNKQSSSPHRFTAHSLRTQLLPSFRICLQFLPPLGCNSYLYSHHTHRPAHFYQ